MINYITGNLIKSKDEAVVNTVNTVGVMGKGIALQFKENYPLNYKAYVAACKSGKIAIGKLFVFDESTLSERKLIINFPTKEEWRKKSKYEYIEQGLDNLVEVINTYAIKSVSIPPLGCGNGGLNWNIVKGMIEAKLSHLHDVTINIYAPFDGIKQILKNDAIAKSSILNDAQAMLIYAMFCYESEGEECSLFVANKLAYFLHRIGEQSFAQYHFIAAHYGPFNQRIARLLFEVNGKYIRGLEQMEARAFESLELSYDLKGEVSDYAHNKLSEQQKSNLKNLISLIRGFESSFALEILSSVDFIIRQNPNMSLSDVTIGIQQWSSRKKELFKEKYIQIAYNHLNTEGRKYLTYRM